MKIASTAVAITARLCACIAILACTLSPLNCIAQINSPAAVATTAWSGGSFHLDTKSAVERSDLVLLHPNRDLHQAMPLGNGRLGLAVWAESGYTAQLNRADTLPHRLSPGQIVIPSLAALCNAKDYSARLNLYDGEFVEHGGGITATTYVLQSQDAVAIDVTGADPNQLQTTILMLWQPRQPKAIANSTFGFLAESWVDDKEFGASGKRFGSLSAITADARNLHITADAVSIHITFRPHPDGSYRILIAAPSWSGINPDTSATVAIAKARRVSPQEHRTWWHNYWQQAALLRLASPDHTAEYLENLRALALYTAAAENRGSLPGEQAGVGDLFSSFRDAHQWGPSAFWHWNLRMQTDANLGAGVFAMNDAYFNLYRSNLENILAWTSQHMANLPGICVPETIRFNGRGYENEQWIPKPGLNCAMDSPPYYNARTITTGAEVSLWVWQQFLYTDDKEFLARNYPLMRESARFLLAYSLRSSDGTVHTYPSNGHETLWDIHDPTTDISAMHALFPAVIQAATLLHTDTDLIAELQSTLPHLLPLPRIALSNPHTIVAKNTSDDGNIIAQSYDADAKLHNSQNIGLEPVWPYSLIGDDGEHHALAVRTYLARPNKDLYDWSYDPIQSARLGLADEFRDSAIAITKRYQTYPSGLASFSTTTPEFYVEQIGVIADALQTALVQDYDDLLRIAPAWPKNWNAEGSVYIHHKDKVDFQIRDGKILSLGIEAGSNATIRLRNPWPGQAVTIADALTSAAIVTHNSDAVIVFTPQAGKTYLVSPSGASGISLPFTAITGEISTAPKSLGTHTLGIP